MATTHSKDIAYTRSTLETISAAKTLDVSDSGKIFVLSNATGAEITLPAPVSGLNFKFVVGLAFATTSWTIVTNGSSNIIYGTVLVNGASVVGSQEDTITFAASAETLGDFVQLETDGTSWFVAGIGSAASSITLTQAS